MQPFIILRSLGDCMSAFTPIHTPHDVVLSSSLTCEHAQRAGSCHLIAARLSMKPLSGDSSRWARERILLP